jgi:predicted Zn-dependent peptidase
MSRTPADMAATLGHFQLMFGDRLGVERFIEATSKVTPEDARQVLGRYFHGVSIAAIGSGDALDEATLLTTVQVLP